MARTTAKDPLMFTGASRRPPSAPEPRLVSIGSGDADTASSLDALKVQAEVAGAIGVLSGKVAWQQQAATKRQFLRLVACLLVMPSGQAWVGRAMLTDGEFLLAVMRLATTSNGSLADGLGWRGFGRKRP